MLEYPDYYNFFIRCGQLVDSVENEEAFIAEARKWAKDDEETLKLIEKINPEEITRDSIEAKNKILKKYGYRLMKDKPDYFMPATILFNPNYLLKTGFLTSKGTGKSILIFLTQMNLSPFL